MGKKINLIKKKIIVLIVNLIPPDPYSFQIAYFKTTQAKKFRYPLRMPEEKGKKVHERK